MSEAPVSPEITSDDKLMVALCYVFAPLVGIVMLLMEDKKARPYIKFNAVQSIVASLAFVVVSVIVSVVTLGFGGLCVPLLWLVFLYWAYQGYQGQDIKIPVVSDFIRNQGWA
jgi:uncharacterized membrane protein